METLFGKEKEYSLKLDGKKYRLFSVEPDGCIGYGGSSIVYKAREEGEHKDYVVIKEFYPQKLNIERNKNRSIHVNDEEKPEYEKLTERVKNESEIVDILRHKGDKNNPWVFNCSKPIPANNTFYTVIATEAGEMLSDMINNGFFKDKDFAYICDCILKILNALKPIHDQNYLHLDISPGNIHFSDLGIARLIDFNSAFKLGSDPKNWFPSHTPGYSADELENFDDTKPMPLSYQTDFYSVAAIFSKLLVGRPPEDDDWRPGEWLQLASESEYLKGASNLLVKKTSEFLERGLKITPEYRFKDIIEMREAVEELKKLRTELEVVNFRKLPYDHFVGRKSELKEIDQYLKKGSYVILEGIGGIGKSELAKRYANDNEGNYDIIQFITFKESLLSTIANSLEINNFDYAKYKQNYPKEEVEKQIFAAKMSALQKCDERTLIIIDNYNVAADDNFHRLVSNKYKVIFTSRERHSGNAIEVLKMKSDADLLDLFYVYYHSRIYTASEKITPQDKAVIQDIIKLVLGHTMTVMLIASAMRVNEITPDEMYKRLSNSLDPELQKQIPADKEEVSAAVREQAMEQHITTLFGMAEIIGTKYAPIMTNMAIIPYTGLEKKTFFEWALPGNKEACLDLDWLVERRWVQTEQIDRDIQSISLHPVISYVADKELKPDSQKCAELVKNLITYARENERKTYIEWARSKDFLELACKRIEDATILTVNLMTGYAKIAEDMAEYKTAEEYKKKALDISEDILGKKQLKWYQKIFGIYNKDLRQDYYRKANRYNDMGLNCTHQGNYREALEYFKQALTIDEKIFGKKHPNTASVYCNIGDCYSNLDKIQPALKWHFKAISIFEKELGKEHEKTAVGYSNIGLDFFRLGMYSMALEYYQRALPNIGQHAIVSVYMKMGQACFYMGQTQNALECCQKALPICEKVFGLESPDAANIYNAFGLICHSRREYNKALEWYFKVLVIDENIYKEIDNPEKATTYDNIALAYRDMGNFDSALEWLNKSLFIKEGKFGKRHIDVRAIYRAIATVYEKKGNQEKAREYMMKAMGI